uniref:Gustatory receptor n=1 Tax=Tetranychus urticae TaxID=32264 RepID=T1KPD8_TETUR
MVNQQMLSFNLTRHFHSLLGFNSDHKIIRKAITRFNSVSLYTFMLKNGCRQHQSSSSLPNFTLKLLTIRLLVLIMAIRYTILTFSNHTSSVHTFLGNPFYLFSSSPIFNGLMLAYLVFLNFCREYWLYLESKGCLEFLTQLFVIHDHGFSRHLLALSLLQSNRFKRLASFCLIYWFKNIHPFYYSLIPLFMALHAANPFMWSNSIYFVASSIWCLIEISIFLISVNSLVISYCIAFIFTSLYVSRLTTLTEQLSTLAIHQQSSDCRREVESINRLFISFSNDFDEKTRIFRYFSFLFFMGMSITMDVSIFLGLIIKIHSPLVTYLLSFSGLASLVASTAIIFLLSKFWNQFNRFCGCYSALMAQAGDFTLNIQQKLKILYILERCSYNGVRIGDLCFIQKSLIIHFFLENASTILLLVVNLRSLQDGSYKG